MSYDEEGAREFIKRELERCRTAFEAGIRVALIDALWLCSERPFLTPGWVIDAMLASTLASLTSKRKTPTPASSAGRAGNDLAAYRLDMMHFERWATVRYVRDVQDRDWRAGTEPRRYNLTGARIGQREIVEPGRSWDVAFRRASALLRGSAAQGTPATMKKSYEAVAREMKSGNSARYHIPVSPILMSLLDDSLG
jgi:hypothetical protein